MSRADSTQRDWQVANALGVALCVNLSIAIAKIVTDLLTGSVSILAAGFDSLLDALSEIIGLVTLLFARQPADLNHPYGHRKAETLGTLIWRLNQSCATAHYHLTKRLDNLIMFS